ncbi:MAG: copper chaperone PCu(A)C [Proteobacteria bacterium]|nr:copper chaperone PCu(A)C [Pseudomonadota bacterium]
MKTGLLVPAIIMLAACHQPAMLSVDKAWVRLTPVAGAPSSAYFTITGGARDETLTDVSAPDAMRAEMHENVSHAGIESMNTLKLVAVRAGGEVPFALGGKHVMLFGLKPKVQAGTTTPLIFTFASGQKITVNAKVMPPGSSAPQ